MAFNLSPFQSLCKPKDPKEPKEPIPVGIMEKKMETTIQGFRVS